MDNSAPHCSTRSTLYCFREVEANGKEEGEGVYERGRDYCVPNISLIERH